MEPENVRNIVHDVLRQEGGAMHAGLFSDDSVHNFFAELKTLINDCFQTLHTVVHQQFQDVNERGQRYQKGLDFFSGPVERIGGDEMQRAQTAFPGISTEYQMAMVRYAQSLHGTMVGTVALKIPSFDKFLFQLYKRVAGSLEVRGMRYFTMSYLEQEIFLKDVVLLTMKACMTLREGASGAGAHIRPCDSVSNIGASSARQSSRQKHDAPRNAGNSGAPAKSMIESVLENVRQPQPQPQPQSQSQFDAASLTNVSLRKHDKQMARRPPTDTDTGRKATTRHLPDDAPSVFISKRTQHRHSGSRGSVGPKPFKSVAESRVDESAVREINTGDNPTPNPTPRHSRHSSSIHGLGRGDRNDDYDDRSHGGSDDDM
jgi:hypothetical protein